MRAKAIATATSCLKTSYAFLACASEWTQHLFTVVTSAYDYTLDQVTTRPQTLEQS